MPRREKTPEQIEHDRICREMHLQMIRDFKNTENKAEIPTEDLLALLFSFSMRKCDYKEQAETMLRRYGSFVSFLDMPYDSMMLEPSIRLNTALMLRGIPALIQKKMLAERPKRKQIKTPHDAEIYLRPYFVGSSFEQAFLLILSDRYYPKAVIKLGEGLSNEVYISPRIIFREMLMHNCSMAILAHSHPAGEANASKNDKIATLEIANILEPLHLRLLDHLIFTKRECTYLSEDQEMDNTVLAFSKREHVSIFKK